MLRQGTLIIALLIASMSGSVYAEEEDYQDDTGQEEVQETSEEEQQEHYEEPAYQQDDQYEYQQDDQVEYQEEPSEEYQEEIQSEDPAEEYPPEENQFNSQSDAQWAHDMHQQCMDYADADGLEGQEREDFIQNCIQQ